MGQESGSLKRPPVSHLTMTDTFSSSAFELMIRLIGFSNVLVKSGLFVAGKPLCGPAHPSAMDVSAIVLRGPMSRKPLDTQRAVSNPPLPSSYRTVLAKVEILWRFTCQTSKAQVAKLTVR